MNADRIMFAFDGGSIGPLTVEATRNGAPLCVLRSDGSEFNLDTFKRGITQLAGMNHRYQEAVREALAAMEERR